jgi:hypothetical protein
MPANFSVCRFSLVIVESLDARVLLSSQVHSLASGPLLQDWGATSLIQSANNWTQVPGIEGYRGNMLGVAAPGVDPQIIIAPNESGATTQVYANQSNPGQTSGGGVGEFHLPDPTVAIQGTAGNAAPHLLFYLNTTGLTDLVPVSYVLRDIDDQSDKAIQPVAAQYRVGNTGNFVNIPAAFVADAAGDAGVATKTTPVSFNLPAETLGQPLVQLRIITTDAEGADEWIGIDDIRIGADQPRTIAFSQATFQADESAGTLNVTLTRGGDLSAGAQITLATSDLTATSAQDYTSLNQVVAFSAGQASRTIPISIVDDSLPESAERIQLSLSTAVGASIGSISSALAIIVDDDSTAPTGMLINEISVDPPGAVDTPYEFAEIRGPANLPLRNVYLVQFEGDLSTTYGRSGVADVVFDLGESFTGSNGMLMIAGAGGFVAADGATSTYTSPLLSTGVDALENDAQSWLLVFSPVPILAKVDYDPFVTDGGSLNLPAGAVVLDSVAWRGQTSPLNSVLYSNAELDLTGNAIAAATRARNSSAPNDGGAWYFGSLDLNEGTSTLRYDAESSSTNLPVSAVLTPGAANYTSSADTTAPQVVSIQWQPDLIATKPRVEIVFSEPMQSPTLTNLASSSFTVIDRATSSPMSPGDFVLTRESSTVCRIAFAGSGIPADGHFRVMLNAVNLRDLAGNPLAADESLDFSFLQGDATGDQLVDTSDFNHLAGHFGESLARFSDADFSFDGSVDSVDFSFLIAAFGRRLSAPSTPAGVLFGPPADNDEWPVV